MCGSGPYERDAKGNIDFDKEDRTRIAEVIDFLDPNFKKVIHGNFPTRDHCFGGILNVMATHCGESIKDIQPFFGGGFAERGSQKDVFILNDSNNTKTTIKWGSLKIRDRYDERIIFFISIKKIYLVKFNFFS